MHHKKSGYSHERKSHLRLPLLSCVTKDDRGIIFKSTFFSEIHLARDNLSRTKKKYHKTIDEQAHLAFRWGISDIIENQSVATTKIWSDTSKVGYTTMLCRLFIAVCRSSLSKTSCF